MTTAIVTGFTVHAALMQKSFAPLLNLRRRGVLDRVIYMTWDDGALDDLVAPAMAWREVEVVRVPQPRVSGIAQRRGFILQSRNIAAALKLVGNPAELVVKSRPDFLFDEGFLEDKIGRFGQWRTAPDFSQRIPPILPPSPFQARIWVPWGDGGAPFYYEDAAFIGLAGDLEKLVTPLADELIQHCGDDLSVNLAHVLRFAVPFLNTFPIFLRYIRDFHLFRMNLEYRKAMVPICIADPYYWHLAVAHAWIMAANFHVDCGRQGQLHLVTSSTAHERRDRPVEELCDYVTYKDVEAWRALEEPGSFLPLLTHAGCRLMDDDWQMRLFSGPVDQGYTHENLLAILSNVRQYQSGLLSEMEETFYGALNKLYRDIA
jgi:hypothetical protein